MGIAFAGEPSSDLYPSIDGLALRQQLPLHVFTQHFGRAPINKYNDLWLHENYVCYENKDSVLELGQWENDGLVYEATIYTKTRFEKENKKWRYRCASSKRPDQPFHFDSGLSLGMTRMQVRKLLGARADKKKWRGRELAFWPNGDTFVYGDGKDIATDPSVQPDVTYNVLYDKNGKAEEIYASMLFFN